ncbi:hypothetical protein D3C83_66830 [compost metagenome]
MRLSADDQHHVFDRGVVELFPRRGIDGPREIHAGDEGTDVLLHFGNGHGLGGDLHDDAHGCLLSAQV